MGVEGARRLYPGAVEDPDEDDQPSKFPIELCAAKIFVDLHEAECGAQGEASGYYDLHCREIFHANNYSGRNLEHAGDAGSRIGGGYFSYRAAVL